MTNYDQGLMSNEPLTGKDLHIVTNGGSTYAKVYLHRVEVDKGDFEAVLARVVERLGVTLTFDRDAMDLPVDDGRLPEVQPLPEWERAILDDDLHESIQRGLADSAAGRVQEVDLARYDTSLDPISPDFDPAHFDPPTQQPQFASDEALAALRRKLTGERLVALRPEQPAWWYVNVYSRGREYGGPEEGGWWFDTGCFDDGRSFMLRGTKDEVWAKAREEDQRLNDLADAAGTPPVGTTQYRGGRYTVRVESTPGQDFPVERPYYC